MLEPLELIVIAVIVLVFFMFGPKKIPELAKSIGMARKEFSDASALASGKGMTPASSSGIVNPTPPSTPATGDALIDTAKRLGIQTEGKSRQELSNAIVDMTRS